VDRIRSVARSQGGDAVATINQRWAPQSGRDDEVSGVVSRARDDDASNRADDISLESLVRKASSRPPRSDGFDETVVIPLLPRLDMTALEASIRPSVAPLAARPPLPGYAKWMIAVPWALLAIVVVAFAFAWPRGAASATRSPTYALAPIPQTPASPNSEPIGFEPSDVVIEESEMIFVESEIDSASESRAVIAPVEESVVPVEVAPVVAVPVEPALEVAELPVEVAPVAAPIELAPPVETAITPEVAATAAEIRSHMSGPGTPTSSDSTVPAVVPERPSRSDVSRALRAVGPAVDACTTNVGTATIHIVVSSDGSVSSASATGEYANTSEGACMANAVRSARFAPFTQPTLAVTFPFALR